MQNIFYTVILFTFLALQVDNAEASYVIKNVDSSGKFELDSGEIVELGGIYITPETRDNLIKYLKTTKGKSADLPLDNKMLNAFTYYVSSDLRVDNEDLISNLLKLGLVANYKLEKPYEIETAKQQAETEARKANAGLWAEGVFVNSGELEENGRKHLYKFRIVEGVVKKTKLVKDRMYINFGDDWKTDFTVKINKRNLKHFKNIDFDNLDGRKVMARGWVEFYNGPAIEIYNISHLEII